jgi:hypothetical protein
MAGGPKDKSWMPSENYLSKTNTKVPLKIS